MRNPQRRAPWQAPAIEPASSAFGREVGLYLSMTPRQLPSRYLYDPLGSALFEAICRLPWYSITRAETALLEEHADAILAAASPVTDIVELGPGNGEKLGRLLAARPPGEHRPDPRPVQAGPPHRGPGLPGGAAGRGRHGPTRHGEPGAAGLPARLPARGRGTQDGVRGPLGGHRGPALGPSAYGLRGVLRLPGAL